VNPEQKDFARKVGTRLRELRQARDLERTELAEKASVKWTLVRDAEQGVSRLTLDNAFKLAHALGVPVDVLWSEKAPPPPPLPKRGRPKSKDD